MTDTQSKIQKVLEDVFVDETRLVLQKCRDIITDPQFPAATKNKAVEKILQTLCLSALKLELIPEKDFFTINRELQNYANQSAGRAVPKTEEYLLPIIGDLENCLPCASREPKSEFFAKFFECLTAALARMGGLSILTDKQPSLIINQVFRTISRTTGEKITVTSKELQIISLLEAAPNHSVSKTEIIELIWGKSVMSPKNLGVHLTNLRKKLEPLRLTIQFSPPDQYLLVDLSENDVSADADLKDG